ncbi:MAG: bifunctional adenosylcobinamide kinase/adenosylcobinamide-phosphate guanylyltransferase [Firmicutes bacterium]|nr:bifunctional adenosylcobinamide kinase/adenosylcobinamide-phosphate guanylyltransferase [Bacillota bacterium]
MILIFGGSYQGKLEFAKETFGVTENDVFTCTVDSEIDWSKKVLYNLDQAFLRHVREGKESRDVLKDNLGQLKDKILIVNDISQGIVPMERENRDWREMTGRAMLFLSKEADEVYRVFCGLGSKIK